MAVRKVIFLSIFFQWALVCSSALMAQQPDSEAETSETAPATEEQPNQEPGPLEMRPMIIALFPEKACGSENSKKANYIMTVIACATTYRETDRDAFLDLMFKNGYKLRKESYMFAKTTGVYDYEFSFDDEGSPSLFFIKLHFRNAPFLYKSPYNNGRIILFVDNVSNVQQLTRWQSLGLKISYGVPPFKEKSGELAARIGDYGQNLWMSLSLNPMEMTSDLGSVLSVNEVLEQKLTEPYLDRALEQLGDVDGVIDRAGTDFLTNITALRQLFDLMKARKISFFIDSARVKKSAAFDTARLMSLRSFRPDLNLQAGCLASGNRIHEIFALAKKREKVLVLFSATDNTCFKALKRLREARKIQSIDFIYPSESPQ